MFGTVTKSRVTIAQFIPYTTFQIPVNRHPVRGPSRKADIYLYSFLTSKLDGGGGLWSTPCPGHFTPCQSAGEPHDRSAWVWKTENLLPRIGVRTPDSQIRRHTDYSFQVSRFQRTATPNRPKYIKIPNTVRPETILTNPVRQIFIFCAF